jgi:hypothetical protein
MKTYHEKIVDQAKDRIRRVHSDQSVSLGQVLDSLELLRDEILDCIAAIEEDIRRTEEMEEL